MKKVALRSQLRKAQEEAESWRREAQAYNRLLLDTDYGLREAREALSLARAGLLIALPHVEVPAARALVGWALEMSEIR